jgi:hypothetical protein
LERTGINEDPKIESTKRTDLRTRPLLYVSTASQDPDNLLFAANIAPLAESGRGALDPTQLNPHSKVDGRVCEDFVSSQSQYDHGNSVTTSTGLTCAPVDDVRGKLAAP